MYNRPDGLIPELHSRRLVFRAETLERRIRDIIDAGFVWVTVYTEAIFGKFNLLIEKTTFKIHQFKVIFMI